MSKVESQVRDAAPRHRGPWRRRLEWSWIVTVVLFTLARLLLARETLADYGLNIWVFGVIDLATAYPYALGTARVVGALVDRDLPAAGKWTAIAVASFFAPYLYIAAAGADGRFPPAVYVVLLGLIVVFGGNAVRSTVVKVRRARQELTSSESEDADADAATAGATA